MKERCTKAHTSLLSDLEIETRCITPQLAVPLSPITETKHSFNFIKGMLMALLLYPSSRRILKG